MCEVNEDSIKLEISAVVNEIQHLQSRIAGTEEPASQLELYELQRLGRRYGTLIARLRILQDDMDIAHRQ